MISRDLWDDPVTGGAHTNGGVDIGHNSASFWVVIPGERRGDCGYVLYCRGQHKKDPVSTGKSKQYCDAAKRLTAKILSLIP